MRFVPHDQGTHASKRQGHYQLPTPGTTQEHKCNCS